MTEIKKYHKLLQGDGFEAGKTRDTIKKGRKTHDASSIRLILENSYNVNPRESFDYANASIEEFHMAKDRLRKSNESRHKSQYTDLLEGPHGLVVGSNNRDILHLTNLKNWHSTEFNKSQLLFALEADGVEDPKQLLMANYKTAIFDYNPYLFKKLHTDGKDNFFNEFQPPEHFFTIDEDANDWPAIQDFFKHFFTKDEDYQYLLDWLANSLVKKNNIFLLFPAAKGIGKNFLAEQILLPLYGASNFSMNRKDDMTSKFNAALAKKQIAIIDEFTLQGSKDTDAIKIFTNKHVPVEEKFKARETKEISCNILLFTNRINKLRLESDQRRFSIIPLTGLKLDHNEQLIETYGTIDNLGDEIQKDIPAFYKFLRNRLVTRNMNFPLIDKDLLEEITFASATQWELMLDEYLDEVKPGQKRDIKAMQEMIKAECDFKVKVSTIIEHLKKRNDIDIPHGTRASIHEVEKL